MTDRIIFDFETTGLYPDKDKVVQIAALKFEGDKKTFLNIYVNPGMRIPKVVSDIHGIDDMLIAKAGWIPENAWRAFADFIDGDLPLIGHNIFRFDVEFLKAAFKEYGLALPKSERYYDTAMVFKAEKLGLKPATLESHEAFCRKVGDMRVYGLKFNLGLCMQELGHDCSAYTAHTADGDVEMTNLLYLAQTK